MESLRFSSEILQTLKVPFHFQHTNNIFINKMKLLCTLIIAIIFTFIFTPSALRAPSPSREGNKVAIILIPLYNLIIQQKGVNIYSWQIDQQTGRRLKKGVNISSWQVDLQAGKLGKSLVV